MRSPCKSFKAFLEHTGVVHSVYLALTQLILARAGRPIGAGEPVKEVLSKELCLTSPGKPLHHTLAPLKDCQNYPGGRT